jgi:hypothetical protein
MRRADFEAEIRFLSKEEGGRESLPFQGYRCDLKYKEQEEKFVWMIWPAFLDEEGNELPQGQLVKQKSKANMYIINQELRKTVHQGKIREGVLFHLGKGQKIVADGKVTRILNLLAED